MTDRQNDAAEAANYEADRLFAQAKAINSKILVLLLLFAAVLVGFNWPKPAEAAKRNVYKGTVTICYAPTTKAPKIDQYLFTQWNLEAAVKAAGPSIGKVKVVKERYPHTSCYGQVSVWSSPEAWANSPKKPYDVYTYGERGVMWESQITMGDKVGVKLTAAQRQAYLVAALKTAIPR